MFVCILKKTPAIFALLFTVQAIHAQTDTIINRYKQFLISSVEPETDIKKSLATLATNHQWPDLNYSDTVRAFWQPLVHLKRVRDLALVWANPNTGYYNQENLREAIHHGLDHWLEKRYKNSNWWHNEIGVPQMMRDIIILFRKELSGDELREALQVLSQHRVQGPGAGANLAWSADLGLHYGALTGNETLIEKCRQLLIDEIKITTSDGVQPDYSFHQHGERLQMYQYGAAFLKENARLAWELLGTKWEYPQEKTKLLIDFVIEGWQWMARGVNTVPGTIDRSCSRRGALKSADLRNMLPYLETLSPSNASELNAISFRQNGDGTPLNGFRYFPFSDFSVYHQKDFSFFLKTISSRTLETESINSENLKGQLLNSGDAYIIRNGKEYFNLMPVWDWNKLPGLSSFNGAKKVIRREFAGSVSDDETGLTAMDYSLQAANGDVKFSARKTWACHMGLVISMIAEVENTAGKIFTSLDQCRLQGNVNANTQQSDLYEGHYELQNVKWLYHAGVGYILLTPSTLDLNIKQITGTWRSINASETDSLVTEKVFNPVLKHQPHTSTGYVMVSGKSLIEIKEMANKPSWTILRNDKDCQAVIFNDGTVMVSFFSPCKLAIGNHTLSATHPCLVLIKQNKIYVSNPAHDKKEISIQYDQRTLIFRPENGFTSEAGLSD